MSSSDDRIRVVCAGLPRAGHRHENRIIELFDRRDGRWFGWIHEGLGDATPSHRHDRGGVTRTASGWRFRCPKCGVEARVPDRLITDALERLETAGARQIDLATLNALARNG